MDLRELRQKRANLWEQAKALHERAKGENRDLTAEELVQWNGLTGEMDSLKATIDREERIVADGAELNQSAGTRTNHGTSGGGAGGAEVDRVAYRDAFWAYMRRGSDIEPEQRQLLRSRMVAAPQEARALGVSVSTAGGFAVANEDMQTIVDAMKAFGGMRQSRAQVLTTSTGADLPIPTNDDTGNKGAQVAENTAVTEQDTTFGQKVLRAYLFTSKIVRVSYAMLEDSSFPFEAWLTKKLGERLGRIVNEKLTTGSGAATIEGVVTGATSAGTTAAATTVTYPELLELYHGVDVAYRDNAQWMFNDLTLKKIKQIVDAANHYIWTPGIAVREPDTILGAPYIVNNDVAAIAASQKSILFGDFSSYLIRDVNGVTVLRLTERYADYLQVGFLAFSRHDGVLADAGQHPIQYLTQHA